MDKICRICLEEGVLTSIFAKNYNISLCEMLEYCGSIKISKDDGLPEQLCNNCIYKLGIAYHFKQTCKSADIRLRQYLGLALPIKQLDAAVMTDPISPRTFIIKKCKCKFNEQRKYRTNYKRKQESEKLKRGPKPKPKQIHACYQCNKEFRCQALLDTHLRTHTGDRPYGCMYCSRRFTQKHNLTIHLRVHTGEKPFQCEVCSKTFSAQGNLQAHIKIHTGQRDHICSMCNKSFITSSELTRHTKKHTGIKEYKCNICGALYMHARDLKIHNMKKHQINFDKVHHNSNKIIDIIGIDKETEANNLKNVNQHVMPHEKKPPNIDIAHQNLSYDGNHTCAICGDSFEYINALAQHYLKVHKGE